MPKAVVEMYNGSPAIMIDGVPYPPMTITVPIRDERYLHDLGEAGLKIYYVVSNTAWNEPGEDGKKGITDTVNAMALLLKSVPDAYVILRLNVSPPADWVNGHPEEMVTYNDGSHGKCICTSVGGMVLDGMHSLCSERWRKDGEAALREYFDALEKTPYFDRIIGFFLCAGGTSEWYYPGISDVKEGTYSDFSESFRKEFSAFLKRKYGTEEELRRVWKREDATFEHPIIPSQPERQFNYGAYSEIEYALRNWENSGYTIGRKINIDGTEKNSHGVFLNANAYAHVADFYDAWHEATANTIIFFGGVLKKRYPQLLVGAFYGGLGCTDYFDCSTATGTPRIMDSGVVDFLATPGVYNNREPGGMIAQREMQDSFRLRNEIFICEDDTRTHLCGPWMQRDSMALYTAEDSVTTMKRDFARDLCEDVHGWWFDMAGNWYDDPAILALIKRQQYIAKFAYSLDRRKKNEIALIYDTESTHLVSMQLSEIVTDHWRTTDLCRIGAPVDYYFHNDMAREDMPDYKLYIMVNQYCLSDAEREAVFAKARRNNAVVLWLYAPGFVNYNAERTMDVANISKTVGMNVCEVNETRFPYFRVDRNSHPALALARNSRRYGCIDREIHSNIWMNGGAVPLPFVNPGFYVEDSDAVVLGKYCHDGKTAMALSEKNGFRSVYCATHVVRSDLLASLAAWAGCHLYTNAEDGLYANESFVCIHAADDGKKTIRFKHPCSPYEVYEKRYYGENVTSIEVDMTLGETKMWCVADKKPE